MIDRQIKVPIKLPEEEEKGNGYLIEGMFGNCHYLNKMDMDWEYVEGGIDLVFKNTFHQSLTVLNTI